MNFSQPLLRYWNKIKRNIKFIRSDIVRFFGKLSLSILTAISVFYSIAYVETNFRIKIKGPGHLTFSPETPAYELSIYIENNGWVDKTLTSIELDSKVDYEKFAKNLPTPSPGTIVSKPINERPSYIIELVNAKFPISIPKRSIVKITLDKLSSLRFIKLGRPLSFEFGENQVDITLADLGFNELAYNFDFKNTKTNTSLQVNASEDDIVDSISGLTALDKLASSDQNACESDFPRLLNLATKASEEIKTLTFFNKNETYRKLSDGIHIATAGMMLLILDVLRHTPDKDIPIEVSIKDYKVLKPHFLRLYLISKLLEKRSCLSSLMLFDTFLSKNLNLLQSDMQLRVKSGNRPDISVKADNF